MLIDIDYNIENVRSTIERKVIEIMIYVSTQVVIPKLWKIIYIIL